MKTILCSLLLFLAALTIPAADTQTYKNFGIQLSIPLEWQILDKTTMATFQTRIEALAPSPVLSALVLQYIKEGRIDFIFCGPEKEAIFQKNMTILQDISSVPLEWNEGIHKDLEAMLNTQGIKAKITEGSVYMTEKGRVMKLTTETKFGGKLLKQRQYQD